MSITKIKRKATEDIIVRLTFDGAFQRAKIYEKNISDKERKKFRNSMAVLLPQRLDIIRKRKRYTDKDHFKTIATFAEIITKKHTDVLSGNKFRIGNAQKFINLYWKLCWLLKKDIPTPIHCPFDSIIMKYLPGKLRIPWTKFDKIDEYKNLVNALRLKIGKEKSIAEWELEIYQKAVNYTG